MKRWLGLKALVHDAIDATTHLVREGHASTHRQVRAWAERAGPLGAPVQAVSEVVELGTEGTLQAVHVVQRVVEQLTDAGLDAASLPAGDAPADPIPLRSDVVGTPAWIADAALGAVNAAIGDHLSARANGLDLGLQLRHGDAYLAADTPAGLTGTVVVFVHGLGTTEWCWSLHAEAYHGDAAATFGSKLADELGVTVVYARYNTGRPVGRNGEDLAAAIERHVTGADRVVLVGHSMGGLVSRAATGVAARAGHAWFEALDTVITLGTPHQGAPLARLGQQATEALDGIDLPAPQILGQILAGRSLGIRDLEHGDVVDWGPDPDARAAPADRVVPLEPGIRYAFLSATVGEAEDRASSWLGDLLVRVDSASGPVHHETFPIDTHTFDGVLHHQLQVHPSVYAQVRALLE